MQNRDVKMRFGGCRIYYTRERWGGRLKYLPRGSLEVCASRRSEILMDYGMIGLLGLPADILQEFLFSQSVVDWFL